MSAGRVTAIWGSAYYRQQDGSLAPVRVGDDLVGGQQILTDQNGIVEIEPAALSPKILKLIQAAADIDRTLKDIEAREPEVVPAAGLDGSFNGSLLPGIRVDRVAEVLTPNVFGLGSPEAGVADRLPTVPFVPLLLSTLADTAGSPTQEGPSVPPPTDVTLPPGERGIQVLTLSVSEEGLRGSLPDASGSPDTTNAAVQTVQMDLTLLPSHTGLSLVAPVSTVFAATGQPLVWLPDGHGGLVAKTVADPTAPNVVTAELDPVTGRITVTLLGPLQHAAQGEDALTLDVGVRIAGSGNVSIEVATVHVSVEDDAPSTGETATLPVVAPGTNLMIVLDTSADMAASMNGPSRLQAALQALDQILDQYAHAGPVAVRLVVASDTAQALGDTWVSADAAKTLLGSLLAHGGHAYDASLVAAQDAFTTEAGRLAGAQNVSYFFAGGSAGSDAVNAAEEAAWARFLADHQITSHAIGVGDQVTHADLDPIAYDGQALVSQDAVLVSHRADLAGVVRDTAVTPIKGSVLDGLSIGADGFGLVHSIVVDGHTHLADPTLPVMTVHTALGGTFTVDVQTGQYSYLPPSEAGSFGLDPITFTVVDRDGDSVTSVLNAVVNRFETVQGTYASETLTGHEGTDVFAWHLYEAHLPDPSIAPSVDHVKGFQLGLPSQTGADVLDLRDLLQGEHAGSGGAGLSHFLVVDSSASGSTIHVSTAGQFDGVAVTPHLQDHAIVLDGVDLRGGLGLSADASSAAVINQLLAQGQLYVDA